MASEAIAVSTEVPGAAFALAFAGAAAGAVVAVSAALATGPLLTAWRPETVIAVATPRAVRDRKKLDAPNPDMAEPETLHREILRFFIAWSFFKICLVFAFKDSPSCKTESHINE